VGECGCDESRPHFALANPPPFPTRHSTSAPAARQASLRRIVSLCAAGGIACPSLSASLGYLDQYRRGRLPANLTQAQRDFFGAHTYERTDKPGAFHTEWAKLAAATGK
jgi:6-phosphogluconate dehydrogenase